jgi:hypothetical protein
MFQEKTKLLAARLAVKGSVEVNHLEAFADPVYTERFTYYYTTAGEHYE